MIKDTESYRQGFIAGLDAKENQIYKLFGFDLSEVIDILEKHLKNKIKISTKQLMTKAEANNLAQAIFGNRLQAEQMVNFFIDAGMLEIKKKEERPKETVVLFETIRDIYGVVRLETWPEGLVLWVNGKIKYKYWEDTNK